MDRYGSFDELCEHAVERRHAAGTGRGHCAGGNARLYVLDCAPDELLDEDLLSFEPTDERWVVNSKRRA